MTVKNVSLIGTLVLSLVANVVQVVHNARQDSVLRDQLEIDKAKWQSEKGRLEADRDKIEAERDKLQFELKNAHEMSARHNRAYESDAAELEDVNKAIAIWDKSIFQSKLDLQLEEAKATEAEQDGKKDLATAFRQSVEVDKQTITWKEAERQKAADRKKVLELRRD